VAKLTRKVRTKKSDGLDSRWFSEDRSAEGKQKTDKVLRNSTIQFRLLKAIIEGEFEARQISINDINQINIDQRRWYQEGYLKALQDIYNILP